MSRCGGVGPPAAPAFWAAFGDPASHDQRGRAGATGKDCDHAARAPAASFAAGRGAPEGSTARVARHRHCVQRVWLPGGSACTMPYPARPGVRCFPGAFVMRLSGGGGARSWRGHRRRDRARILLVSSRWRLRPAGGEGERRPLWQSHKRSASGAVGLGLFGRRPQRGLRALRRRIE